MNSLLPEETIRLKNTLEHLRRLSECALLQLKNTDQMLLAAVQLQNSQGLHRQDRQEPTPATPITIEEKQTEFDSLQELILQRIDPPHRQGRRRKKNYLASGERRRIIVIRQRQRIRATTGEQSVDDEKIIQLAKLEHILDSLRFNVSLPIASHRFVDLEAGSFIVSADVVNSVTKSLTKQQQCRAEFIYIRAWPDLEIISLLETIEHLFPHCYWIHLTFQNDLFPTLNEQEHKFRPAISFGYFNPVLAHLPEQTLLTEFFKYTGTPNKYCAAEIVASVSKRFEGLGIEFSVF